MEKRNWHELDAEEVLAHWNVSAENGLDEAEADRRLAQYGPNELIDRGGKSPWKILLEQLTGVMVLILIVSAVISIFLGDYEDAIAILAIVVLNTILGFTQEYRAERAMSALKKMTVPVVRVRRGGRLAEISARELVPGDVLLLEAGNTVPADGRVIESANLRVQEAVLTGESEPVEKSAGALTQSNLTLGDRRNLVYSGTAVTYGRGRVVVTATGMHTELGRIAEMIQSVGEDSTPLQRRLEQLGKGLAIAALVIVSVVFLLGLARGEELRLMFLTAISLAVAAVPEGLPTVVTIALALGAQRMLQRRALIRKLPAVETLGSVTVICSDKTGTLTENRMTVTILDVAGHQLDLQERLHDFSPSLKTGENGVGAGEHTALKLLLAGGALCNDAVLEETGENQFSAVGDPTEGALVVAAARAGLRKEALAADLPRQDELPFDSERKRMTTLHRYPGGALPLPGSGWLAFTKGAVDGLLTICDRVWVNDHSETLDETWRGRIQASHNQLAQKGMRVLGLAYRLYEGETAPLSSELERGLVFVGMTAMIDPARPEVRDAVHTAQSAGIRPVMITGDHPLTALHIARQLGIAREGERVMTGQELANCSFEDLERLVESVPVYARVSPEHKLKIVEALQKKGHIVAMTGDGVNDAPALKKADIGVAMGITGTDVSKESAEMVLLDDNFATIVAAVEEGRRIYDNIRKFIKYALTSNSGEIWVMLFAPFLGMPLPLLPLQILWINLVTDGLPGLALTLEPAERNAMRRPPYSPRESIFGRGLGRDILWIGFLLAAVSLGLGLWGWQNGKETWQTMVFTTVTLAQMGNALALRSERESLFSIGLFSNKLLLLSVLLTTGLQLAVVYIPFLQEIFNTVALPLNDLLLSLGMSLLVFLGVEAGKWLQRRSNP